MRAFPTRSARHRPAIDVDVTAPGIGRIRATVRVPKGLRGRVRDISSSISFTASKGLRLLRAVFDEFGGAIADWLSVMFLSELAAGLGSTGQTADALIAAEQAIERAEDTEARWLLPESLRIKGELLLQQAADGAAATAEACFRQALDWARRQGALSWELRAATSLARLVRDRGRAADAMTILQPVYHRFTEGFDTADLKAAKALLNAVL
jgi:predicted ATPase